VAARVDRLLLPSIRIAAQAVPDGQIALGRSKIGGRPDLPAGVPWPRWQGRPLPFLAQLRLADMTGYDGEKTLPGSGLLYFFYDTERMPWGLDPTAHGGWRVIYCETITDLRRTQAPALMPPISVYRSCVVEFSAGLTLPPWDSHFVDALALSERESDSYYWLEREVVGLMGGEGALHRSLGYPDQIQGEMLEARTSAARLLLQLDSAAEAGMAWGDRGRLYFWIEEEALRQKDFGRVWVTWQCH